MDQEQLTKRSEPKNEIAVLGLGHVGLPTALGLAELGWRVIGTDSDEGKVAAIQAGTVPFYEPGVPDLLETHLKSGRFIATTDIEGAIRAASVLFICVGTPQREDGQADLRQVEELARMIARNLTGYKLIVEKSTVPAITSQWIKKTIRRYLGANGAGTKNGGNKNHSGLSNARHLSTEHLFDVASNPEFLQEGKAVENFFHPDRIVCGVETETALRLLLDIYRPLGCPIVVTDLTTAELTKHAANAFLSTKISFINMVADLCEELGGNVDQLSKGIGLDHRIGTDFLQAGVGFGGYCFPKDLRAFIHLAEERGVDFSLLREVERVNQRRVDSFLKMVLQALWVIQGKTIGVLGLAFKSGTDDIREAPSLKIISRLLDEGAVLRLYDPCAIANVRSVLGDKDARVTYCDSAYEAARDADALLILTEWDEFRKLNLAHLRKLMSVPTIVDGRNLYEVGQVRKAGFEYYSIGRGSETIGEHAGNSLGEHRWQHAAERTRRAGKSLCPRSLVTGGAGFIGSHVCERLIDEGHEVICADNLLTGKLENISHLLNHPRFHFVNQDVTLPFSLKHLLCVHENGNRQDSRELHRLDFVLHLASPASPRDYMRYSLETLRSGSSGTQNCLDLARATGAVFLLASTSEVYGDPEVNPQSESYWGRVNPIGTRSVYDEAKRFAEALAVTYRREHNLEIRIARIFNTYGQRMRPDDGRVLPNFLMQALQDLPLTVYGDGRQTRSLCHVSDLVEGLYRLLISKENDPVNLGNPDEISILDLAREIIELTGSGSSLEFHPLPTDDPAVRKPDISKARTLLGWEPKVGRREGIQQVIPYFASNCEVLCGH